MRVESFALDLATPLSTAEGTIERREGWVITVEHDGRRGIGESTPLAGWTEPAGATERRLAAARADADRHGLERAVDRIDPIARPAARHGVELAALDAAARSIETPLAAMLGAASDRVPLNATIGRCAPSVAAERAESAADRGFPAVKCKAGASDPARERERIAAVDAALPETVALRVDANGAWSPEFARAVLTAETVDALDLLEQPLAAGEHAPLARLRAETGVAVALDESVVAATDPLALADAADAIVCKPMALGGLERAREIAIDAHEAGLRVIVSTTVDAVIARTAAAHLAASLPAVAPSGLATGDRLAADLAADPTTIAAGHLEVPDRPGLGIEAVSIP